MTFLITIIPVVNFQTLPLKAFVNLFIHHIFMESQVVFRHWVPTVSKSQAIVSTITLVRMKEANEIVLLHAQQ